jgi:hypothetical protein
MADGKKPLCFVVGPIGKDGSIERKHSDLLLHAVIKQVLMTDDLTDLNANAFYELGMRHSTEKSTIHVAKAGTLLPFDTVAHRTIFVDPNQ